MIRILVADDIESKVKNVRNILDLFPEVSYDIEQDLVNTKRALSKTKYDLLILDLHLPQRAGDMPKSQNGKYFLNELNRSSRLIKPSHVLGLSAFEESISEFKADFEVDDIWALIKYEESSQEWEDKLKNKISYLIQSQKDLARATNEYEFDLAIVTALRDPELQSILNLPGTWNGFKLNNDTTKYYRGVWKKDDSIINVVTAAAPQMGMVSSTLLTLKMITNFRPRYVCMTGIAAGMTGSNNIGDILAADLSFDSGSGKIISINGGSKFLPDFKSIPISSDLKEDLLDCSANREYMEEIKNRWVGNKPDQELNLRVGPVASGAGVVQDNQIVQDIKDHQRKLIGIDMETYGVFYGATHSSLPKPFSALSFKSVSDFADESKNDDYQKYAAFTSSNFLYEFAINKMNFDI